MKQEKFIVINLVKDLIVKIDQYFVNFPKKDIELKRSIKETSNSILLDVYILLIQLQMQIEEKKYKKI